MYRLQHAFVVLEIDHTREIVFSSKTLFQELAMGKDSLLKVTGYADVERALGFVGHYVD